MRLLRGLAGVVGKLLYGARDGAMISPFYLDLLTLRIIGVLGQCVPTVSPPERMSSVCFPASLKKSFLMLLLFYIPKSLPEPACSRDVDDLCPP